MNPFKIFLVLLLSTWSFSIHAQFYTYKEYNHTDGLQISQTLSVSQNSNGNLYIGTDGDGVVKFNGSTFENIFKAGIDKPYHVTGIVFDKQDVFFSTKYSGVYKYSNNRFKLISFPDLDKDGSVKKLARCENNLVFATTRSIYIIDLNGKIIDKKIIDRHVDFQVKQILETSNGTILFTSKGNFQCNSKGITSLKDWLNTSSDEYEFGSYDRRSIRLYDVDKKTVAFFRISTDGKTSLSKTSKFNFSELQNSHIELITSRKHHVLISTISNELFQIPSTHLSKVQLNVTNPSGKILHLLIDQAGDYWLNSTRGVIKISLEPFTKIDILPDFSSNLIYSVYIGSQDDYLLTVGGKGTYCGVFNQTKNKLFENLLVYQYVKTPMGLLLCSNEGVYIYNQQTISKATFSPYLDSPVNFAVWEGDNLWFYSKDVGLLKYDSKSKQTRLISKKNFDRTVYCGLVSTDGKTLYLGTNNQLMALDLKTEKYHVLKEFENLGSYCGNATKDRYGNCWFTLDKGIAGILKDGRKVILTDKKILPSVLFYSLSSDLYGNLIVGTNLGIHILRMEANGNVKAHKTYNYNNGFTGYETNMRAVFQNGNRSYVGTSKGLYIINTEILEEYPVPPKPVITKGRVVKNGLVQDVDNGKYLTFETVLSKNKEVDYYYRIVGIDSVWIELTTLNELRIPDLDNGLYQLEVKSTYDDRNFSEKAVYSLQINNPVWTSKWFIVIIVVFLGLLNIGYLEWTRTGMQFNMYEINYNTIDSRFIPKLLTFGAIVNTFIGLMIYFFVDPELGNVYVNIVASILLVALRFFVQSSFKKDNSEIIINFSFYLAISILFGQYFVLLFLSNIHPYPIFAIILVSSALPYLIKNIYSIIIICLLEICASIIILIWVDVPVYNGVLFMLAMGTSSALTILVTYLRNDSLEKMFFVSNILNKGNMIVLAFNQKGLVNYCSKNISRFFNIDSSQVVGKSISSLNPIVVSAEIREFSMENEFEDGKIILAPMYNHAGEIIWIEWACKSFTSQVRVVLGQDVTEKLLLSTNYQSLVENAHDLIFNTDIDGNFLYMNEMSSRIFGYKNENLVGKNSVAFVQPEYRDQVKEFFRNQIVNRIQNTYLEFPIKTKDGRTIWLGQNASIVFEPGSRKRVSGFTALARDITEKRANELLIEQQNKDITSSINSAKRIQYSLIPKSSEIGKHFDDYFVLFKPKDIVSGDFYWVHKQNNKLIIVLADCTGHGVPGAFMTILGINLLNQLIIERKIENPEEILNSLNFELQKLLHQDTNSMVGEGMDALVVVLQDDQVHFASSGVALIHIADTDFNLYRSTWDELPGKTKQYSSQTISIDQNDKLYLISNGFQHQFGSIRNKKFSFKRILELLKTIHVENMPLQKKYFENAWSNWSEGHEQTDDITVIGLRGLKK